MRVGRLSVEVDRKDAIVRDAGVVVATARWTGRALEARVGALPADVWQALEAAIVADERQAVTASEATAHDEGGVDLTLIDWMLSLTPTERLRVLARHASELSGFVRDDVRE